MVLIPRKLALALISLLSAISCVSLRAPSGFPPMGAEKIISAASELVQLDAMPLRDNETYLNWFDDYLPEIGIIAVWVSLRNISKIPIGLDSMKWILRTDGTEFSSLSQGELFKLYYKRRGIRAYTLQVDESARSEISRLYFKTDSLAASESRQGLVFFSPGIKAALRWPVGAVLISKDLHLSDGRNTSLDLSLTHASP